MKRHWIAATLVLVVGCSGGGDDEPAAPTTTTTTTAGATGVLHVPDDYATITDAVDAAAPGAIVLVGPGVYRESVTVATPGVTLRGTDRNEVIIDGEVERSNAVVLAADGTAVQNLTVRNATLNGVLVSGAEAAEYGGDDGSDDDGDGQAAPLDGFLVDHVTAANNGLYGIYAFNSQRGVIQGSYASGSADAGIYVGQCKPCDISVRGNVAERNAVGYEATNASGPIAVHGNRFVGNRVGATSVSGDHELLAPQEGARFVGNVIAANAEPATPAQALGGFGIGLGIAGGVGNEVARNRIEANPAAGVVVTNGDDYPPIDNQVTGNAFAGNGVDVAYTAAPSAAGTGNCADTGGFPACPAPGSTMTAGTLPSLTVPPGIAFSDVAAPPSLPSMDDPEGAGPPTVDGLPDDVDLAAVTVPAADLLADQSTIRW